MWRGSLGASRNADYVYFVAGGNLAPGATSGERNLYVEHDGASTSSPAIPPAAPVRAITSTSPPTVATPPSRRRKGRPATTTPARPRSTSTAYGSGLECASCRPSGEPPTGDASIAGRALSDDGSRLFFQSTDAVLPQAQSSLSNVFEYAGGEVFLLTPGDGSAAFLAGASASGDDVFIATFEALAPKGQGPVFAHLRRPRQRRRTSGAGVDGVPGRGLPRRADLAAGARQPGQLEIRSAGNDHGAEIQGHPRLENDAAAGAAGERGDLSVVGRGLKPIKQVASGTVTITLALSPTADKRRAEEGFLQNRTRKSSSPLGADSFSRAETTLKFITASKGRGGEMIANGKRRGLVLAAAVLCLAGLLPVTAQARDFEIPTFVSPGPQPRI